MTIPANNPDSAVSPRSASAFVPQAKCRRNATHSSFAKISTAAVLLLLAVLCTAAPAAAAGGTTGSLTWDLTGGTLTISGNGAMPDYYWYSMPWFQYMDSITSVVIKSGVTSIGSNAFYDFKGITSVELPSSVTSISYGAFYNCRGLTSVTIAESGQLKSIGDLAFAYCYDLTSIDISSNLTSIGDSAFRECRCLTSINIPASVTSIGDGAFEECSSLIFINVDEENTKYKDIDGVLFSKDGTLLHTYPAGKSATSYEISSSVTSIGKNAFSGSSCLTSIEIPSSVTSIGYMAFGFCSGLTSINIPSSVKSIGNSLFWYCSNLTSVELPSSVTSINGMFGYCSALTSIELPSGVTSIGSSAFKGSGLTSIELPAGVTSIGYDAFEECSGLTSLVLPSGVTSIDAFAFMGCSGLTSIELPSGVKSIGNLAFSGLAANSIIYCSNAAPLSGKYSTSYTALAVKNTDGSCTFTSDVTNLALSAANAPSGSTYGGWFKESTFTTPVTSIAKGTNPTLWLKIIPAYNNITVTSTAGGDASASPSSAIEGTVISLNADPALGYLFKEWQVLSGGVTIVNNQFTMPDCDVEIKAVFEPDDDFEWLVLSPGWNFVSVPINLSSANDTAEKLFAGVDTTDKSILSYNAETKLWELVRASTKITPLNAYWIYSVDELTLTPVFNTAARTPAAKNVYEGWNAVGLSAEEPMSASAVFNNMGWRTYISWNATEQKYNTAIIKGGSGIYSDDNLLYLWKGGWVYMDEEGTLSGA